MNKKENHGIAYEIIKRIFDVVFAVTALILLLPFLLIVSIIVYIDDPHSPPIFVQTRVKKGGKLFRCLKFRTMIPNAEAQLDSLIHMNEKDGPMFKIKNDPRITKVGHFLRITGIDELPQLLNIISGSMSFVGPRPCLPKEYVCFSSYERQKTTVKPGLTCLWQICPQRDKISFQKWIELDLKYIRERSLLLDAKILFLTIGTVIRGDGE